VLAPSNLLNTSVLKKGLSTKVFGSKFFTFETIDSTNNCARALAGCWADEGTVVLAEEQTAGKGRQGRSWYTNPQENLTFSVILRPKLPPDALNLLPLLTAVAIAEAIEAETGLRVQCKWPNDILVNGKKASGILIEGSVKGDAVEYVVLGIGINVNQTTFPADIAHRATSLRTETGQPLDRVKLLQAVLRALDSRYRAVMKSGFQSILPEWISRSAMMERQITVSENGNQFSGVVKGLAPDGALIVTSAGTERTLYAGDVTIIGM
jgi:BirA family biotin operon repressor/biotin-[acetyl-CoA-carboxylase] ligase